MKVLVLVVVTVACSFANAKTKSKRVDFDRETASSKTAASKNSLSDAFQDAIKGSDQDLNSSKSSVLLEQSDRLAKWSKKSKQQIVIQATSAVDPATINGSEKISSRESQIDTDKAIKNDLTNLH